MANPVPGLFFFPNRSQQPGTPEVGVNVGTAHQRQELRQGRATPHTHQGGALGQFQSKFIKKEKSKFIKKEKSKFIKKEKSKFIKKGKEQIDKKGKDQIDKKGIDQIYKKKEKTKLIKKE